MDKQIVSHIVNSENLKGLTVQNKRKLELELLSQLESLKNVMEELNIDSQNLFKTFLDKLTYNQYDTREKRHIFDEQSEAPKPRMTRTKKSEEKSPPKPRMTRTKKSEEKSPPKPRITRTKKSEEKSPPKPRIVRTKKSEEKSPPKPRMTRTKKSEGVNTQVKTQTIKTEYPKTQEEKVKMEENKILSLRKEYLTDYSPVKGYDLKTSSIREKLPNEFLLAIVENQENLLEISDAIPNYIKYKTLRCESFYLIDIPNKCAKTFPDLNVILIPNKTTVMVIMGECEDILSKYELEFFKYNNMIFSFINPDLAETIDDDHPNKFWFFENYNPKRSYNLIYSNSRKSIAY